MTIVAQISDLHLLEDAHGRRTGEQWFRLRFLSAGRALDAAARRERVRRALWSAFEAGADHLVLTGDLTEDGTDAQWEVLAALLFAAPFAPERVTLVPGNHDAYDSGDAFARALEGPLRPWAASSRAAMPIAFDDVVLMPISSAMHQHYAKSAGAVAAAELEALNRVAWAARSSGRAVLAALHHPPLGSAFAPWNWIDGLRERREMNALLRAYPLLHVIHGHTHEPADVPLAIGGAPRIFGAGAVVDSHDPLRLYHCRDGGVVPIERTNATPARPPVWSIGELAPSV